MPKKILIVEDDTALANMYKSELESKGYTVELVTEGTRALATIKEQQPDMVLLDIMLPGKNGLEILQDMRADDATKETKVIVLTNFGNEENVSTALEHGALDYIMKYKIVPAEMSGKIAALLGDTSESVIKVTN